MLRVVIPILISVVVVLLVVGLAMRMDLGQLSWAEEIRHRVDAIRGGGEPEPPEEEVTA